MVWLSSIPSTSNERPMKHTSFSCNILAWGEARTTHRGQFQLPWKRQQSHSLASLGRCPGLSSAGPKPTTERGGHTEPQKPSGLSVRSLGCWALFCLNLTQWLRTSHLTPGGAVCLFRKRGLVCGLPCRWSCRLEEVR